MMVCKVDIIRVLVRVTRRDKVGMSVLESGNVGGQGVDQVDGGVGRHHEG